MLRAGYGRFFGHIRLLGTLGEFNNFKQFSISIPQPAYPDPYQGRDPLDFIVTAQAPNITVVVERHDPAGGESVHRRHVDVRCPSNMGLHVDYVYNRAKGDYKTLNINFRDPVTLQRPLPQYGRIDQIRPDADLKYQALYVKAEKRYSHNSQFLVSYTFTDSDDNNPMGRYLDVTTSSLDDGPSSGERSTPSSPAARCCCRGTSRLGALYSYRTAAAVVGDGRARPERRHLQHRSRAGHDAKLGIARSESHGGQRLPPRSTGSAAISESDIDSSRISLMDMRVSKALRFGERGRSTCWCRRSTCSTRRTCRRSSAAGRVGNALSNTFGRITSARPSRQIELAIRAAW